MAKTILSRYLNPEVLGRISGRRIEPRGLVIGIWPAPISRRCRGSPSSSPDTGNTCGATTPSTSTGASTSRGRSISSSSRDGDQPGLPFVLDISASMRYGDGPQQKMAYASQMVATLAMPWSARATRFAGHVRRRDPGHRPAQQRHAQIIRMTDLLDQSKAVAKTACRVPDRAGGRMKRREIVMIFSDFFTDLDALEVALQRFASAAMKWSCSRSCTTTS